MIKDIFYKAGLMKPGRHESEMQNHYGEFSPAFHVIRPAKPVHPFIFNSPHSGRIYPKSFIEASRLDPLALRKSEDVYVDELFMDVPSFGVPFLHAHFPRAYLDVNREPYELDPELFSVTLPEYANTKSIRVIGGLGTIARVVTESEEIYHSPLCLEDALARIKHLYMPYHTTLENLLKEAQESFGISILIDCHSMPSVPAHYQSEKPDFVLGDRFGKACDLNLTELVRELLSSMGYVVTINKPYAGGYITENYGKPANNSHALQIEVNRALYMNENTYKKNKNFEKIRKTLNDLVQSILEKYRYDVVPTAAAAE